MTQPPNARPGAGAASPSPSPSPSQDAQDRAAATAREREREREREVGEERLADALVRLVGGYLRDRVDPENPSHYRYFEWLAEEARAMQTPEERARTARAAEEFASRVRRERAARAERRGDTTRERRTTLSCERATPASHTPCSAARGLEAVRDAARIGQAPMVPLSVAAGVGRDLWDEPCDRWLVLPPGVPPGPHVALPVRGDSMRPLLHDGDTLLVRIGTEVVVGDVIVARRPEHGYVVKRVAGITRRALRLASDNAAYDTFTLPRDPSLIVGVVVLRWCPHGTRAE